MKSNNHSQHPKNAEGTALVITPAKWSEQKLLSRLVLVALGVMLFSVFPNMFYEFMTAKSWTENTSLLTWILASTLVILWFVSLNRDQSLFNRLTATWKGNLSIIVIPLMFIMLSSPFINKSVPIALHLMTEQAVVRDEMNYTKARGKKFCPQRIKIAETDELESGDLCMAESQRNILPERGTLSVIGKRSDFGMVIERFSLN